MTSLLILLLSPLLCHGATIYKQDQWRVVHNGEAPSQPARSSQPEAPSQPARSSQPVVNTGSQPSCPEGGSSDSSCALLRSTMDLLKAAAATAECPACDCDKAEAEVTCVAYVASVLRMCRTAASGPDHQAGCVRQELTSGYPADMAMVPCSSDAALCTAIASFAKTTATTVALACTDAETETGDRQGRIVGGQAAVNCEFPFQVSLRTPDNTHFCGGSIIDESWILTSAICCTDDTGSVHAADIHVIAGWYKLSFSEYEHHREVEDVIIHPDYADDENVNDICLLKLYEPLELSECVYAIALPASMQSTPAGTMCTLTGWGLLSEEEIEGVAQIEPNVLVKVSVPVVSDENCVVTDGSLSTNICAGLPEGGKGSCQGDGGGPFFTDESQESRELIGIVAWSPGCARPQAPVILTEVSSFIDWITVTIAKVSARRRTIRI